VKAEAGEEGGGVEVAEGHAEEIGLHG
jgi:hypothetical protein